MPLYLVQKHINVFQTMRIVCYFINYNDAYYLPFFHRHYSQFCEHIVMYDQYSTDGSPEIAKILGIEVRNFGHRSQLNDQWYLDVKNHCWKECRGKGIDYVIVVDIDEFVVMPPFPVGTFPKVEGFNMISEDMPEKSMLEIKTGSPSESYSKQAIFNPDAVQEINYVHGCHKNYAVGNLVPGETPCKLYHYRMIGGVDRLIRRHAMYRTRLSAFNRKHKMGFHYEHSDEAKKGEWAHLSKEAQLLW